VRKRGLSRQIDLFAKKFLVLFEYFYRQTKKNQDRMEWGKIDALLKTKFQRPSLPDDFVPREGLVSYFLDNIDKPLILVSSDSGSGKSLFVSSCLDKIPYPHAWVSLDTTDNDLRNFLSYFVMAVHRELPFFGEKSLSVLSSSQLPPPGEIVRSLINDLDALDTHMLLVVDDLHLISNPEVYSVLSSMLEFPPPLFHLVLISRTDPPLPLERLRAKNKVTRLGADHLRLSYDEIKLFVEKNLRITAHDPLVRMLERKTEGWATGLRLAMLHLSLQKEDPESSVRLLNEINFSGNYFMEEVLKNLDPVVKEFLLKTSVLERFTPPLTDYLLGWHKEQARSHELLRQILQMNLFVVNLDKTDKWFRYHHLFQDFLRGELEKGYPEEEITLLHERATDWYGANGLIEDAFYHAIRIGAYEKVADMIEEHMDEPLNKDKWYILDDWLSRLPEEYLHERPSLLVASMWVMHNKATWVIPDLLREISRLGENTELDNEIKVQVRFFQGVVQYWATHLTESLKSFEYVRKNLSKEKIGAISVNNYYYLTASHNNGMGEKAVKEIEKLLLNESLDPFYRAMLIGGIAYVRMLEGNLDEVDELSRKIREIGREIRNNFLVAWSAYLRGMCYFYQNRLEEAEKQFGDTLDNIYMLNLLGPLDSFAGHVLTLQTLGKKKKLERILEKMSDFVRRRNNPAFDTFMNSFRSRLALLEGNMEAAGKYMNNVNMYFESGNLFFWIETPRITYCKYLLAMNDPEHTGKAGRLTREIEELARRTHNVSQLVQVLVLRAVVERRKGSVSAARAILAEALERGMQGSWVRPFFESAPDIRDLLEEIEPEQLPAKFRDKIMLSLQKYVFPAERNTAGAGGKSIDEEGDAATYDPAIILTNRELDVLLLLAGRLSNKEIANRLFISVATVKRHAITIYRKLGVNKRREAVSKAEKLGILRPHI
jgi:LuxR family maltose regulon positive regulatory protein